MASAPAARDGPAPRTLSEDILRTKQGRGTYLCVEPALGAFLLNNLHVLLAHVASDVEGRRFFGDISGDVRDRHVSLASVRLEQTVQVRRAHMCSV